MSKPKMIEIPADLAARIEALGLEDKDGFALTAITDAVLECERRGRGSGSAEGQRSLHGPAPGKDLSHLSRKELEAYADDVVARMDPALRNELFEHNQD